MWPNVSGSFLIPEKIVQRHLIEFCQLDQFVGSWPARAFFDGSERRSADPKMVRRSLLRDLGLLPGGNESLGERVEVNSFVAHAGLLFLCNLLLSRVWVGCGACDVQASDS